MACFTLPLNVSALGLVPEQCTMGGSPVYDPIIDIAFDFDGAVSVAEKSVATVYSDEGGVVATGAMSASNYIGSQKTQGTAIISFENPLVLPKGKSYRLVVPKDVIYREGDPSVSNDELVVEFNVPATLGDAVPSIESDTPVEKAQWIGFYFGTETASLNGAEAILLREGVAVRTYDLDVSWDWNLGYAGADFGEPMNFEAGVRYTLQIPKGSVSALHRPDITNEELSVSFTGGYTEPLKPLDYVWCSLYDSHPSDVLGTVSFYYDQPVMLSENPVVRLYIEKEDMTVKEVVPALTEEEGKWVLTADFENTPLIPEKGYSIIIPEGTLVTKDGDVVVNSRNVMDVGKTTGISGVETQRPVILNENGIVRIERLRPGTEIRLFSPDGKMIKRLRASNESVSLTVPNSGIYVLSINNDTYKIVVK